jgi:Phage derived protein Gp49-like (DUF891)
MAYDVRQWPSTVYPGEVNEECPEAREAIDVLLRKMTASGPSPEAYQVKNLGKRMDGLWQINLKVEKRQIRILYAPDGQLIVLFRIHKKSSAQEQTRAYDLAKARKREYEAEVKRLKKVHEQKRLR